MNAQAWIAVVAVVVSLLTALFSAIAQYAVKQRDALVEQKFSALGSKVEGLDREIVEQRADYQSKLNALASKMDAVLAGQLEVRGDVKELRTQVRYARGTRTEIDVEFKEVWDTLVTREVFDLRMKQLETDVREIGRKVELIPCKSATVCPGGKV